MYSKECFCGKTKKNFKFDIGPAFFNKCCEEAGYDKLGRKSGEVQEPEVESQEEQVEEVQESEEAQEEMAQAVEMTNEEAQAAKEEPDYENMTAKALKELCRLRDIKFSKRDTRAKLIERLTK